MEACVSFNIRRVDRLIGQIYDRHMSTSGLKNTQFTLLRVLSAFGETNVSQLAQRLDIDRTTLTRNLELLCKAGWITVSKGKDRRVRVVALTEAGEAKFREAEPAWEAAQREVIGKLGEERWHELLGMLEDAVTAVRPMS